MDKATLRSSCESFVPGDEASFNAIVTAFITLYPSEQQALAGDCEVAVSTMGRWARGTARPHRNMQKFVVQRIQARLP